MSSQIFDPRSLFLKNIEVEDFLLKKTLTPKNMGHEGEFIPNPPTPKIWGWGVFYPKPPNSKNLGVGGFGGFKTPQIWGVWGVPRTRPAHDPVAWRSLAEGLS